MSSAFGEGDKQTALRELRMPELKLSGWQSKLPFEAAVGDFQSLNGRATRHGGQMAYPRNHQNVPLGGNVDILNLDAG